MRTLPSASLAMPEASTSCDVRTSRYSASTPSSSLTGCVDVVVRRHDDVQVSFTRPATVHPLALAPPEPDLVVTWPTGDHPTWMNGAVPRSPRGRPGHSAGGHVPPG